MGMNPFKREWFIKDIEYETYLEQEYEYSGTFLTKVIDGEDRQRLTRAVRQFGTASTHKPPASRKESRELYLCVREFDPARLDSSVWREEGLHAC